MDASKQPPELEVWSYVSKGMNRGPRVGAPKSDDAPGNAPTPPMYSLTTGTSFVMFVNSLTFQSASAIGVLPADRDWIPALSVVEITIAPRHSESCLAGRGVNVKTMRISNTEMDAFFQNGVEGTGMPFSASDAMRNANERREMYPALLKDIETEKVSYVVPGASLKSAYMGELPMPGLEAIPKDPVQFDGVDEIKGTIVGEPVAVEFVNSALEAAPRRSPRVNMSIFRSPCSRSRPTPAATSTPSRCSTSRLRWGQ